MQNVGECLRETANQIAWLEAQPCSERPEGACAEQRMQLFAEDRGVHVAAQPGTRDRTQTQLFHTFNYTAHGTMCLHEVDDGRAECFARRLSPP